MVKHRHTQVKVTSAYEKACVCVIQVKSWTKISKQTFISLHRNSTSTQTKYFLVYILPTKTEAILHCCLVYLLFLKNPLYKNHQPHFGVFSGKENVNFGLKSRGHDGIDGRNFLSTNHR